MNELYNEDVLLLQTVIEFLKKKNNENLANEVILLKERIFDQLPTEGRNKIIKINDQTKNITNLNTNIKTYTTFKKGDKVVLQNHKDTIKYEGMIFTCKFDERLHFGEPYTMLEELGRNGKNYSTRFLRKVEV